MTFLKIPYSTEVDNEMFVHQKGHPQQFLGFSSLTATIDKPWDDDTMIYA